MAIHLRDNKRSATLAKLLERRLDLLLGICVHSARGFVQKYDIGSFQDCASDCNTLELTPGKFPATSAMLCYSSSLATYTPCSPTRVS